MAVTDSRAVGVRVEEKEDSPEPFNPPVPTPLLLPVDEPSRGLLDSPVPVPFQVLVPAAGSVGVGGREGEPLDDRQGVGEKVPFPELVVEVVEEAEEEGDTDLDPEAEVDESGDTDTDKVFNVEGDEDKEEKWEGLLDALKVEDREPIEVGLPVPFTGVPDAVCE